MSSENLDKLAPAIVALQAELVPVDKSATNPFFSSKYAPLPEVRAAMQPLLAKHRLALVTMPSIIDGKNGLQFHLIHESGQELVGEWFLTPAKHDSQGEGADTTYKRRFGEMAITGLVADDDDDGCTASSVTGIKSTPKKAPAKKAQPEVATPPLEAAKADLRAAIKSAGLTAEQSAEYAWVKDATDADIENIKGIAEALKLGKAV